MDLSLLGISRALLEWADAEVVIKVCLPSIFQETGVMDNKLAGFAGDPGCDSHN